MSNHTTTARPVHTDSLAIYRTVKSAGTLAKVWHDAAAGEPAALAVLAALEAESRHESHAFGIGACVRAALAGAPYAEARDGAIVRTFV